MTVSPQIIAQRGEEIYARKYKQEYEQKYQGQFVAISITSEKPFLADTPEAAMENAQQDDDKGLFHLIKIGSMGVFKVGFASSSHDDWIFQRK